MRGCRSQHAPVSTIQPLCDTALTLDVALTFLKVSQLVRPIDELGFRK